MPGRSGQAHVESLRKNAPRVYLGGRRVAATSFLVPWSEELVRERKPFDVAARGATFAGAFGACTLGAFGDLLRERGWHTDERVLHASAVRWRARAGRAIDALAWWSDLAAIGKA